MTEPQDSGYLEGELFVTRASEEYENVEEGTVTSAVFMTDTFNLLFRSGIGSVFNFETEHIHSKDDRNVYYPYYNETVVEANNPLIQNNELEMVRDDVHLRYIIASNELYVASEIEITAYSPNYIVYNDTLYAVDDPMIVEGGNTYQKDELLGLDKSENSVRVRNVQTGLVNAVERKKVDKLIESNKNIGAIKVQNPKTEGNVSKITRSILN